MTLHRTKNGNEFWIDGVFAFIELGTNKLTYWENENELHSWIDEQYENK